MGLHLSNIISGGLSDTIRRLIEILFRHQLYIDGVEVTEAIQYYHADKHLTDPADRGPDNSVRLVANKPAWVRVYVRGLFSDLPNVTGTVTVQRRLFGFLYLPVATLSPQSPGMVTARTNPDYDTERSTINSTLNFIIPANHLFGHIRLRVRVNTGVFSDETQINLDVTLRQTLRLAGIMVGYSGSNGAPVNPVNITLPAPTLADLQATAPFTLTTMPVQSNATYRIAGTITWTNPLTDPPLCPGCCSQNWINLNNAVQQVRVNDGNRNDVIYYGLMAPGIPMGPIIGCNSGGVSTSTNGDQVTMAHEIGHYLGLAHAPCGTPGDPNYPAYEPHDPASSPNASIGEYGLNINNGNVLRPQTFKDYMSYCGPGWISLYHHGRLINNSLLDPTTVHDVFPPWWDNYVLMDPNLIPEKWLPNPPPDDPLPWRRVKVNPEPLISLIGVVHSQEEVEVQSVARIQAFRDLPGAQTTEFSAELIDEQGNRLVEAPLQRLPSRAHGGCDCGHGEGGAQRPPYLFQAFLPNVAAGTALRIRRSDDEIWIRHAPAAPPRIQRFEASSVIESRALIVEWNIEASSNEEPEAWLQWSSDEGETWHGLAIDLRGQRAELDLSALPSGTVSLRLLAHDGFFTVTSDPVSVEIPTLPPSVAILNPRDGSRMEVGSSLRLWGVVTRSSGEPVEPESARWLIDGEEVARGLDVFIAAPDEGQHRCTLIVETYGETAEANVEFETVALPYESRQGESEQLGSQEEA